MFKLPKFPTSLNDTEKINKEIGKLISSIVESVEEVTNQKEEWEMEKQMAQADKFTLKENEILTDKEGNKWIVKDGQLQEHKPIKQQAPNKRKGYYYAQNVYTGLPDRLGNIVEEGDKLLVIELADEKATEIINLTALGLDKKDTELENADTPYGEWDKETLSLDSILAAALKNRSNAGDKDLTYMAGSLLNNAAVQQRIEERKTIEKELGDKLHIYNPVENEDINDKSKAPTAEDIFLGDIGVLLASKNVIASNSESTGTTLEMGILIGIKIMQEILDELANQHAKTLGYDIEIIDNYLEDLYHIVPYKEVYWNVPMLNNNDAVQQGLRRTLSFNPLLLGGLLYLSNKWETPFDKTVELLKQKYGK